MCYLAGKRSMDSIGRRLVDNIERDVKDLERAYNKPQIGLIGH